MNSVILVGRRRDGGHRDMLWDWCRDRWTNHLGWPIFEGHDEGDEPFNLSRASNRASAAAGDWDVALYVGADWTLADPGRAAEAAAIALTLGKLIFAHNATVLLSEEGTARLLAGASLAVTARGEHRHRNTFSGVLAVPRTLWDAVGGFDERFIGWGYDDLAFWAACCALAGGFDRISGETYHLWHPRSRALNEEQPHHPANQVLGERYLAAKGSEAAMRSILAER